MTRRLALRFDVDTHRCVREGMPALSRLGRRLDAPFTFFVNMGRAVARSRAVLASLQRPGTPGPTAAKLPARAKLGTVGWLTAAFLNPPVGAGSPDVLRGAREDGHEVGLHGGRNHARWQAEAAGWSEGRLAAEIDAVLPGLRRALGDVPVHGFASPGWTTHPALPGLLAERGFGYLADLHGPPPSGADEGPVEPRVPDPSEAPDGAPALPNVRTALTGEPGGVAYLEHLRAFGLDDDGVLARFRADLDAAGPEVAMYDHPYHAGIHELDVLERLIDAARASGWELVPMAGLAEAAGS